jgi:ABC-type Zn uptake system ZnuABC Zn-binding protein ZnuA
VILCLVLAAAALLAGCGDDGDAGDAAGSSSKPAVIATTVQIEALARVVGGDRIALTGLVPAGTDAHQFEPTASDLRAIEGAGVVLRHGIGLDEWLDDVIAAGDEAEVYAVTEGIELQAGALEHDEEEDGAGEGEHADESAGADPGEGDDGGHGDGEFDAHVWHDPDNVKIMVANIAAALAEADPDNADAYNGAATTYNDELDRAKREVQAIIDEIPPERRKLVTNHDAFGYFARAFGLEIVGAVVPSVSTQAEASAGDTAELLETIEREGVPAIFVESTVDPDLARTLAEDAGVRIVDDLYGDALGEPGSGADTIDGMLLANARKIADALR